MREHILTYGPEVQEAAGNLLDALAKRGFERLQRLSDEEGCGAFFNAWMYNRNDLGMMKEREE